MINVYKWAVIDVTEDQWVMLYNEETKEILVEPQQCSGSHTCANTLVIADTIEELEEYIAENGLVYNNFEVI